jgi:serine/threonine-protein kinase
MNKMLGLSFQAQGLLDMAFDSFRKCSLNDEAVKEAIFNLALDFERKRMFNKAISAYEYLLKGGKFKDANDRIWRLRRAEAKSLGGSIGNRAETTVLFNQDTKTKPTLGRYEVLKEIGKGAIGTVYLGRDPKINRKVAIKTLRYDEIDSEQLADIKERFFREAEAAGRLSHPNIVTIYDAGEDYDITYMAMEYLDGHDLARHCRKDNLLPPKTILNIIVRVAFALDYAHKHKVIHRDIKPANIMLTEKGHVKVTDFGIARLTSADSTQTGVILGTPNYMSPEQVLGKKLDGRSDIFSLGAVFYELLTGEKPFKSNNIGNLMHNIASAKFQPIRELRPDVPPCCEALVKRMMTKGRAKRFTSAGEVVIESQQCLENV